MNEILKKIQKKEAVVGVMGLGYVGLPLAVFFAEAGMKVLGFETDARKAENVRNGLSHIKDIESERLSKVSVKSVTPSNGELAVAKSFSELKSCDAILMCVPTPLAKTKDPDLSFVIHSSELIRDNMRDGQLVLLESTTYPGTTRELILPLLESGNGGGKTAGKDFFLAYSPERVDPGNPKFNIQNTPKVVGGMTENCLQVASLLYSNIVEEVVEVSSTDAAELSKLLENTFRMINIGLVNEFTEMCHKLGVDVWEVIDAAATKPFGFMPFYPGPGLGGHCIPVDPHYLSWKLRLFNYRTKFIELASEINGLMPQVVVSRVVDALNFREKSVKGSKVLIMGTAYKADIDDIRESPALDIISLLTEKGAIISYHDPFVSEIKETNKSLKSKDYSSQLLEESDCVVIVTNHSDFSAKEIAKHSKVIVDSRNFIAKNGAKEIAGEKLFKI